MHACAAVDGTARRMYPNLKKQNAARFKACLRFFNWIVEPALGAGIDLEKTRFSNIALGKMMLQILQTSFTKFIAARTRTVMRSQMSFY